MVVRLTFTFQCFFLQKIEIMEKLFVNTWENKLVVNLLNCSGFWLSKDGKSISFYAIDPSSDPDNWDFQSKERGKEVYDALLDKHSTQL